MTQPDGLRAFLQSLGLSAADAEAECGRASTGDARDLLHTLLMDGFWREVVDEQQPPQWVSHWQAHAASGFPIIDIAALQRLLDAGVNLDDLTGVVRSAQILALYNVAQLLDDPVLNALHETEDGDPDPQLHVGCDPHHALPMYSLHSALLQHDPAGRHGEPRSPPMQRYQQLSPAQQAELAPLLRAGHLAPAAMLWKQWCGGTVAEIRDALQQLRHQLPSQT